MNGKIIIFWTIFVAAAIFRIWQSFGLVSPNIGDCLKQNVSGTGIVHNEPERKDAGQIFVLLVNNLKSKDTEIDCGKNFLIRMKSKSYPRFIFGEEVAFSGKLSSPMNFESSSDDGRSFDYKGYLAKDDVFFEIKSAIASSVSIENSGSLMEKLSSFLFSIRRRFVNSLESTLGEPHAALASGLVVGEKAALGNDLIDDFRTVGLIHIVVLSGYNITIVGYAMRKLLSFMPRIYGIVIGGIGIFLFGMLVGGGATVVRSCFMAGIALSANLIRRDYSVIRALLFAALVMLIQNPMILLHDPSFQLSFLATLGLISLSSPIESHLQFITDKIGIRSIIASTIATQIFVSPYILYMMGQISIIGMVVNILVLPFIPLTMFFVFLTGSIGMFWMQFAVIIGWFSHILLSYELFMVQNFARIPFAAAHIQAFSGWYVFAFYSLLIIIWLGKGVYMKIIQK